MRHYDCAVIGTGPAGQKAAIQAAKLGKKVAIIEKNPTVGGASKRGLFGESACFKRDITVSDLIHVSQQVIHHELQLVRSHLDRNGIDLIWGTAAFETPNRLQVVRPNDSEHLTADKFFIASGTRPARPEHVPFNEKTIFCSDGILKLERLPKSMIVVGGGVIGTEYACMMATLGVKVTLVEARKEVLGFLDNEIVEAFHYHMRAMGMTLRLGEKVAKIEQLPESAGENGSSVRVQATLESGKTLRAQTLLYSIGRQGTTAALKLENAGLAADDRERMKVDANYRTTAEHIYAIGDVVGFPALASTAMEQGRLAVCHAFGIETKSMPELFPLGIYAVPEISMVGKTEGQLTEAGIPYEAGVAQYTELARGQLLGDAVGMLKLLIHQNDHKILGVHAIGTGATELIHIGQAVMAFGGTVEFFINNVFNFPTLAEAYKVAALNGLNKLRNI